jgi:hypothetical protein
MMWIPVNKKTKQHQPAITDAEKSEWLSNPFYAERFTFQAVPGSDKAKAPEPVSRQSHSSRNQKKKKNKSVPGA